MPVSLLATKFYIPPPRANGVPRPRLTARLLAGVACPGAFVLLSGPAGFGKTTLLGEFVAQLRQPVAWVSLDEGDNDPIRFWTYLITACQSTQPGLGEAALALFRSPLPLPDETVPAILINDFAGRPDDLVLVLDDFHLIRNQSIHTAFTFLLSHLPDKLHIILSTRTDPPWPLARFRARNQLVDLRALDLRFTPQEAAAFLNQSMGLALTSEAVAALEERTEGWAAGLQLAALSLQGRGDSASFVQAFTGSHVYVAEYLVEEVILRQPEDVQAFLLQTSILEQLNAELCEAVTGQPGGQARLTSLNKANLFVLPMDDEGQWFRYHHLFADLLQARLRQSSQPDAITALHQRAAAWYERAGMVPEAIEHGLAGADFAHVAQLVEKVALPMVLQAYVRTVEGWLLAIPQAYLDHSPRANMAFAWMNLLRGTFAQAAPYLERLGAIFSVPGAGDEDPSLLGEWLAIQSKLLSAQGQPAESRDLANRALQILPEADAHVRSMVYVNLATAYQQMLDYDHAAETFRIIVREAQARGDHVSETLGISGQAQMVLQQGRLHLGFEIASEGINRLEASRKITPFSATLFGELGQIYYHWHQLDLAQRYLQRSIQTSGQSGYSDPEIYNHVMLSRKFQMEGDWDASAQEMQKAGELARMIPPAMIREEVISQQVRVELAFGRLAAAQAVLKPEGFSFEGAFVYPELVPGANVTHPAGLLYNSALRVLLFQAQTGHDLENVKQGVQLAARVLAGELQCRHLPIALETLLVRAQLYAALGDSRNSLADVARALELAEPEGFISIFVEEGDAVRSLIADCRLDMEKRGEKRLLGYVTGLQDAFSKESPPRHFQVISNQQSKIDPLIEALTPRELEVLELIAAGDSNQVIAAKLVITVSAVKKHTGNIFGKLNVNSRTQAVARARLLQLLPETGLF